MDGHTKLRPRRPGQFSRTFGTKWGVGAVARGVRVCVRGVNEVIIVRVGRRWR